MSIRDIYFNAKNENVVFIPKADGQFDSEELLPYASFPDKNYIAFYRKRKSVVFVFQKFAFIHEQACEFIIHRAKAQRRQLGKESIKHIF
ncbi:hypothetical protein MASR1M65_16410 [Saprospiraceae bacterium]